MSSGKVPLRTKELFLCADGAPFSRLSHFSPGRSVKTFLKPLAKTARRRMRGMLQHGSFALVRRVYAGQGALLLYHRVRDEAFPDDYISPYRSLGVSAERFEEQVQFLSRNFRCVSLPQAIEELRNGTLSMRSAVLTFDDGYRDNRTVALPILEKYQVPATIYIATGLIDRTADLWWLEQEFIIRKVSEVTVPFATEVRTWRTVTHEEKSTAVQELNAVFRMLSLSAQRKIMKEMRAQVPEKFSYDDIVMNWDEVRSLDTHPLITLGAHTVNHPNLSSLDERELRQEVLQSKMRLEQELCRPVVHFAYPFGGPAEAGLREFGAAKACGFLSAVTTRIGHLHRAHKDHAQSLPRISINFEDSLSDFVWKLSGAYSMVCHRGKRLVTA